MTVMTQAAGRTRPARSSPTAVESVQQQQPARQRLGGPIERGLFNDLTSRRALSRNDSGSAVVSWPESPEGGRDGLLGPPPLLAKVTCRMASSNASYPTRRQRPALTQSCTARPSAR